VLLGSFAGVAAPFESCLGSEFFVPITNTRLARLYPVSS
jgi:hypothetical protein